jgi:hypothetical protein
MARVERPLKPLPAPSDPDRTALWKLEGRLEKSLVEVFAPNYQELIAGARQRLVSDEKDPR